MAVNRPRRDVRLLHASDCHLGSARTMTRKESAFAALVDLAVCSGVDAVVIAGDMFDTPRVDGEIIDWTVDQLNRLPCPLVILPGNHDWFEDQSPFIRFDFEARCRDVHVLDHPGGEVLVLPELDTAFFGRPVRDHEPWFRPIADLPPRPHAGWCVVIGHGLVVDDDGPTRRGSPIYPADLAGVDWDYVALGHWDRYWQVRADPVPVVYAGNTASSIGQQPGAVLVELSTATGVTPTWTPLETGGPLG